MKVLQVINYLTEGGPTRVLENLSYGLLDASIDVEILTILNEDNVDVVNRMAQKGIVIHQIKKPKNIKTVFTTKKHLKKSILQIKPDIIHVHGILGTILLSDEKIKKISTIHNNIDEDYSFTYGVTKGKALSAIHKRMLKKYDQTIFCAESAYKKHENKISNAIYIRNGIDSDLIKTTKNRNEIREELCIGKDDTVYIYVGVLNNRKRAYQLAKLFKSNIANDEHLIMIGDGSDLDLIKKLCEEEKRIHILGRKKNAIDYIAASDIYTSYSSAEGFSISVIEALEQGLGLFLSNIPSHKECFNMDKSIYIGEYFDSSDFTKKKEALKGNIRKNKISRTRLQQFQKVNLSRKAMTDKYIEVYKELAK